MISLNMLKDNAVLFRELNFELRLERAFDVHMQFRLGKPTDVFRGGSHLKNSVDVIDNSNL